MPRLCAWIVMGGLILNSGDLLAQKSDKKPSKQAQLESEVFDGIAELAFLRDRILKRYALMVIGENQTGYGEAIKSRSFRIDRIYRLQAACATKSFRYLAKGVVLDPSQTPLPYDVQTWKELHTCGLVMKGRNGIANHNGYKRREQGESRKRFIEKLHLQSVHFDPFDDLVLHAMFLENPLPQEGWIEQVYMQSSKFLSAKETAQGQVVSQWRWKLHGLDFTIELTQSKAYDYMPVKVKYTSKIKGKETLFGETDIRWKKHQASGEYLPHTIKAATGGQFGLVEKQHLWLLDWKVGEEVENEFFDCDSEDFRLQFSPLFDFYFDTHGKPGGLVTGTPWEMPEELIERESQ